MIKLSLFAWNNIRSLLIFKQKVILKLSACVPNIYSYGCYIVKTGSNSIINLKSMNHAFIT